MSLEIGAALIGTRMTRRRVLGNPFTASGLAWCPRCRCEMDTEQLATSRGALYLFKQWCARCGMVLNYGAYTVPVLSDRPLPATAYQLITSPEKDRR